MNYFVVICSLELFGFALYWCDYSHRPRNLVSPVCGIMFCIEFSDHIIGLIISSENIFLLLRVWYAKLSSRFSGQRMEECNISGVKDSHSEI